MRDRQFDAACDVLRKARETVRAAGNDSDESFLTSMLVSHLSIAGHDEEATDECLRAEAANPQDRRVHMLTIRQLLRVGRKREAAARCEQMLGSAEPGEAEDRHMLVSSLGECVIDDDQALARQHLEEALEIAVAAALETASWNRTLALNLRQRGDAFGTEYLHRLRSAAERAGDEATLIELDAFLIANNEAV